jgi:hypothetical protein
MVEVICISIVIMYLLTTGIPRLVVMSPSWNFPARAEPSYEGSEPSQAELGHFNFRAETELKKIFFSHFSQVFITLPVKMFGLGQKVLSHLA